MSGVNKVILIGRLGKDPDVRTMPDGRAVASMSLATSEQWRDKPTGEKREKTQWHRIVAFAKTAEVCGQYLSKGSQIYVEGKLQTRTYEKDGVTHYTTEIVVQPGGIQFLGGGDPRNERPAPAPNYPPANGRGGRPSAPPRQYGGSYGDSDGYSVTPPDDDIPF